ncbi:Rv2231c family pyridoxal phosphate-dependent protein CobC [Streptomyces sp. NPDC053741]|uniref:Aminotransferase n=1 Tax=[Kitasatospora] papulosa TaxID=1464011 RepID=A0ABZ1K4D0_9ACTN|nr:MULTISPECIES: Rv2231c family pyridoxal phosphate-dependent protein CobC [Streptomyces]RAS23204.1 histidinol-phosphate aminotransferase [Streptomyces avidinii]SNX81096.1 histidinol-phosphate aminotransferase [Streptomyces microflavus]MCX4413122.1 Rv2231c family pyridoxal phosphate-dependent protein CobC [[Kitasatospora] papulosa]MCY1650860.1 Rv2231c family pyridoxal phosphate-dependent protein CobC [Streptomyces sp. SL203]MCY1681989.1 Rv2231c family pyridoxal phosphate-dependent protein CobC
MTRAELVVGVGARHGVAAEEVLGLIRRTLAEAGAAAADVVALATLDTRADEPGITGAAARLGVPVRSYPAKALAQVRVPHPSAVSLTAVATGSVAEAAALMDGGELLVPKRKSGSATCAVARRGTVDVTRASTNGAEPFTMAAMLPPTKHTENAGPDLRHHGDAEVRGLDLIDLAVNVRTGTPPEWLRRRIVTSLASLAAYPDGRSARAAVAGRHGLPEERVLLTAGAAEAFVLIARALPVSRPVVVHPQFTEPEAALRAAGHEVGRVVLSPEDGFRLDPAAVPEDADLVVVGNPTNPTSVLHPAGVLERLARPGRTLVVDEAFMDAVPGEREALCARQDVPGLVVLRSLTKTWGLAGLRVGYVLADPATVGLLQEAQPLWPVSSPALAAAEACMEPRALVEAADAADRTAVDRAHLLAGLAEFSEVRVVEPAAGPFVLLRLERADEVRELLRSRGFAARRGDTFPGLGGEWLRIAVRDRVTTNRFLQALDLALQGLPRRAVG